MIYIKIDDNTFYDDAIVLVRSFYPRIEIIMSALITIVAVLMIMANVVITIVKII